MGSVGVLFVLQVVNEYTLSKTMYSRLKKQKEPKYRVVIKGVKHRAHGPKSSHKGFNPAHLMDFS